MALLEIRGPSPLFSLTEKVFFPFFENESHVMRVNRQDEAKFMFIHHQTSFYATLPINCSLNSSLPNRQ